jgi:hypothetical protein
MTTRRQFTRQALGSLLTFSLLDTLLSGQLLGDEIAPVTAAWLAELNQLGRDAQDQKLQQLEWQQQVEALYARVDLPELLRFIDFDRLAAGANPPEQGAQSLRPLFPEVAGLPTDLVFGRQVFALREGRSVVPHGHNNMATAFLVLKGKFHGRHYDRLASEPEHYLIRPTIDRTFVPGEYSTISDFKDNVHWFQATSGPAFIFNIHVLGVNPDNAEPTGRLYLDPDGEKLSDGVIRARKIEEDEAERLYG